LFQDESVTEGLTAEESCSSVSEFGTSLFGCGQSQDRDDLLSKVSSREAQAPEAQQGLDNHRALL
jgi:hypothetical protein